VTAEPAHRSQPVLVFAVGNASAGLNDDDARVVAAGARAVGANATFDLLQLLFRQVGDDFFAEVQLVGEDSPSPRDWGGVKNGKERVC
jgi:hypothetical protein